MSILSHEGDYQESEQKRGLADRPLSGVNSGFQNPLSSAGIELSPEGDV